MMDSGASVVPDAPLGREPKELQALRRCIIDVDSSGHTLEFNVKAVLFASGEVFWETRPWLPTLYVGVKETGAYELWRNHIKTWSEFWELAGLRPEESWLPGHRAKQSDVPAHMKRFVRQEMGCTTLALVSLLVGESVLGATLLRQRVALQMLGSILCFTATPEYASSLLGDWADQQNPCLEVEVGQRHCPHVLRVFAARRDARQGPPQKAVAAVLAAALREYVKCEGIAKSYKAKLQLLCRHIDERVGDLGWTTNHVKHTQHIQSSSGRKRRLDEDFKEAVVRQALTLHEGSSVGAFLRANEGGDASAAASICNERNSRYLAAMREANAGVQCLSIALDGSKLGQPLEETEVYVCWNADKCVASVALPQVEGMIFQRS